jgi:truncated hemoglobin YjbI
MQLYEKIGRSRVQAVIERLYDRLFEDPLLSHFFFQRDKSTLIARQVEFSLRLLGDMDSLYRGKPIPVAHAPLGIRTVHMARRQKVLEAVLAECGVEKEDAQEWLARENQLRHLVIKNPGNCLS